MIIIFNSIRRINGETMDSVTIKVSADVDGKTYSCTGNNNGEDDIASNEYTISVLSKYFNCMSCPNKKNIKLLWAVPSGPTSPS